MGRSIGSLKGIFFTPLPRPASPADGHPSRAAMAAAPARRGSPPQGRAARRSTAMRSLDLPLRMPGRGGGISNGISKAQRGEIHCRYAHVSYETTRHVVG